MKRDKVVSRLNIIHSYDITDCNSFKETQTCFQELKEMIYLYKPFPSKNKSLPHKRKKTQ